MDENAFKVVETTETTIIRPTTTKCGHFYHLIYLHSNGYDFVLSKKTVIQCHRTQFTYGPENADFRRKEQHGMHDVSFSRSLDVPTVIHNFVISHTGFFIATAGSIVQDSKTRLQGDDIHSWSHDHLDLLDEGGEHRPHHLVGLLLGRLGLQLQVQQVSHLRGHMRQGHHFSQLNLFSYFLVHQNFWQKRFVKSGLTRFIATS